MPLRRKEHGIRVRLSEFSVLLPVTAFIPVKTWVPVARPADSLLIMKFFMIIF
jgi:hypothetical protein